MITRSCIILIVSAFSLTACTAQADEGMWLFSNPPRELLKQKYNFTLTDPWLERTQKATIRFPNGTGGFVSPHGLVVTNHHIAASTLQKLSTKEKNLHRDGFYAPTKKEELKCPDLELRVLQSIQNVTELVEQAVKPGMSATEAADARAGAITRIESESEKKTGLRSSVVTLYQGGLYHLYRYKVYTDVRLVFAPEADIAFFGGDTDNFEYPRYNLDVSFFRVYENGKPVVQKDYFQWSKAGPKAGDLVFVTGNPARTQRLETVARLKHRRDITLPYVLNRLRHLEGLLQQYGAQSPEHYRNALKDLYSVSNARKAYTGQFMSLLNPEILEEKIRVENKLRDEIEKNPADQKKYGHAWGEIAKAQKKLAKFELQYDLFEGGHAFWCRHFQIARDLVRIAEESLKPDGKRLEEYRESNLKSLRFQILSPAPISANLEQAKLAGTLSFMAQYLGGEHPLVLKALAGKSPTDRAVELIQATKVADVEFRKKMLEGGNPVVRKSKDPMIRFALLVDGVSRKLRAKYESEVEEPERQAYALISKARFKLYGSSIPPDATFTPRLAFGTVKGYTVDGEKLPFTTTFAGLFERAELQQHKDPFVIPESWTKAKAKLDLTTPFNFVSTADTIGGNSGSPVLNREGQLVGINFDRNRHGLVRNYVYTDYQARHISVHGLAVLEALRKIYGADALAGELVGDEEGGKSR